MELRLRNVVTVFKIIFELDFDINNRDPKGFFAKISTIWLDSDLISRLLEIFENLKIFVTILCRKFPIISE